MLIHEDHIKTLVTSLFLVFASLLSSNLNAANEIDYTDDDFFSEIPTVLTVSRLEQPKSEAPSSVTIISRDMIKASGIRELAEIFRLIPGFIVGHFTGNKPTVAYHGMGFNFNRQLQVLVDGRSVFIPSFGGIPWEALPVIIEDIEKIEITRGPNAASYGSNSFLAAINIITTEAYQNPGSQFSISHSDGHKNIDDAYFRFSKQFEDYDWGISLKTINDDGLKFFNQLNPNHDGQRTTKFNLRSNFLIKENSQWSIQIGQSSSSFDKGDGRPLSLMREEKAYNRYQILSYEQSNQKVSSHIKLFHTEHNADDSFDVLYDIAPSLTTSATVSFDRYSERTELESQTTVDWSKSIRFVFGASIRKDTVNSFFLLGENQKQSVNVKRFFAHTEYKINESSIINIGGMLEDSDTADFGFSPRIAYIQHLNDKHTLRIAYSQAFRNPILFELFGRRAFSLNDPAFSAFNPVELLLPNPNLKPEEIESYEVSLNSLLTPKLETDIKLYQYDIKNQITPVSAADQDQYINNDNKTKAKGIEISLSYKPSRGFFITSGINFIKAKSINELFDKSFPNKTAFVLSQYDINDHHSVSGTLYYTSSFNWVDTPKHLLKSSKKLDLRYAYDFIVNNKTPFTLEVIGQNLLSDYADYTNTNIQSRSLFLKLSSRF